MKKYKYDVFISYSRKDTKIVNNICKVLDKTGIVYFIDRQDIGGGLEFPTVLAKAIRDSNVFLFLASKNSYKSKFTQSEVVYAFKNKEKEKIILNDEPYFEDEDGEMKLGFWDKYEAMPANKAFLIEEPIPVFLPIWPDVNCDGIIDISDAIAIIDIIMDDDFEGPNWIYPYYNHQVADVNQDGEIEITDAVLIIDIIDQMNDY